ncbi:hypothetical protein [Marinovum sp.]|uniref:hypothetical protein n=1 Tax=Marinovum sp. TaxID=2024839 RepID=UPI002B274A0C|nr:hypothetical protein [Marinovum sp.]
MFGIFADVFKRATYLDDPHAGYRREEPPQRDIHQRAPFHWSYETRRRLGREDNG